MEDKKYSYVSLLTNDSYVYGVILLVESLKKVNSKYPLHLLITKDVCPASRALLDQLDLTYETVENIPLPEEINEYNISIYPRQAFTWQDTLTKLHIFKLVQFDKIIFLDADLLILKNLDHLFEMPHMTAAHDGEYFDIYPGKCFFNAGCITVQPSIEIFNNLITFLSKVVKEKLYTQNNTLFADQTLLNLYYKDWSEHKELHLNKYYNIFAPYIQTEQLEDIQKNAYFIHFIGRKPWVNWIPNPEEHYDETSYQIAQQYINNQIEKLDIKKVIKKIVLTVYAICKNEKNNIQKWIKCFSEADHVCILDTGSTDGSWELLQELTNIYPNLIISQKIINPWRFDTARNESLKLVPDRTDMYFMVDLDEIIKEPGWCQKVKDRWTPTFSRGSYQYHRDVAEDDSIIRTILEYRIHSKYWYKYENIVHEGLINKRGEKMFFETDCTPVPIQVWHYPRKNKKTDYLELCERSLEENPDNDVMRLQLAIESEIRQNDPLTEKCYKYLIYNNTKLQAFELSRCFTGLGILYLNRGNDITKAFASFAEGRMACPWSIDNYIIPAQILFDQEQYKDVYTLMENAFKHCHESFWCNIYDINSFISYYLIGISAYNLGKKIEGLGYLTMANYFKTDEECQQNIELAIKNIKEVGV